MKDNSYKLEKSHRTNQRDYVWPLLTNETKANGNSMKGVLPWLDRWACRACTRDFCSSLAALAGPVQSTFSLTVHYFSSFVPIAQRAGRAVMQARLSLDVCLWDKLIASMGPVWKVLYLMYCIFCPMYSIFQTFLV